MQAFKNRSLRALYLVLPTRDKHMLNLLYYNCLKHLEFYLCASCVLADLCLCHWCFLCVAIWKEKFPYTGARTPDILKEKRASPWPWQKIGLDQYARLQVSSCQCWNLYTYCRPCFAGYFPVAVYIKLSHMVCEPPIACDLSRWTLEAACKFVAFKNITRIIGRRRPLYVFTSFFWWISKALGIGGWHEERHFGMRRRVVW